MNDIFTKDETKIFKGMTVWLSPSYYMGEYIDGFKTGQEEYIVVKVIDENEVLINRRGEPEDQKRFTSNLLFANKKNAIKDRIIKLGQIVREREEILLGTITKQREEMNKIQRFQDELVMKL